MADPIPTSHRGPGLSVRFSRVAGHTAKGLLSPPLYLPVVLGDVTEHEDFGIVEYDTISAGQFSAPESPAATARKLRTTDFETLTIDWYLYARWMSARVSPEKVRTQLAALGRSKTPFQLLASMTGRVKDPAELRWKATLRSVERTIRPGEADTRYMTLALTEWRDPGSRRLGKSASSSTSTGGKTFPFKITITKETTLRSAARSYGSVISLANAIKQIAEANKLTRWGSKDPIHEAPGWKVGSKLLLPRPYEERIEIVGSSSTGIDLGQRG